jgi:hypothetical protein
MAVRPVNATAALVAITKALRSFDASDLIKTNPFGCVLFFCERWLDMFLGEAQRVTHNTAKPHLIRLCEHFVYIGTNILCVTE